MHKPLALALGALLIASPALAEEKVLNLFIWSDYMAEDTVSNFEAQQSVDGDRFKVNFAYYDMNETIDTMLQAGNSGYDVIVPTGNFLKRQIQAGFIQKLDKSKLPNLANLDPAVLATAAGQDPDNAYAVPYMINTIGYGYNVDKVAAILGPDAPVDSWDLIFKPEYAEKLASCGISLLDSQSEVLGIVLHYLGLDPNSESPEDLAKAQELLLSIRPYIRYFSSSQYIEDMGNGETCVALGYSGDVFQAAAAAEEANVGNHVEYVIPKEGAPTLFDFLAIPADAPHPENAHAFINYILEPKVAADITNAVFYANPNLAATEFVDEEIRANPGIYPSAEVMANAFVIDLPGSDFNDLLTRAWINIKTGQ
ncbi:MAG: spermidine/putrescine ABC transporter substrate-binding protein PotF [Pelagibacterium sp. SCN 64-44]|nr:MAG: spermidine/putrescine ABC transporter substrate-binding protein PotF [Pelagibacterium sp. SCN 64-44]